MKLYGSTSLFEILGDLIVYRNLAPLDPRLPGLDDVRSTIGIPDAKVPRKGEPAYAQVVVQLLSRAGNLIDPDYQIQHLIYLGDTQLNDGNAFLTICQAGNWPGMAFIASENQLPASMEMIDHSGNRIYLANRWSALKEFEQICHTSGIQLAAGTAVIIDLDKTALGARGRNDKVINQARVDAVRQTAGALLGQDFILEDFQRDYDHLNQEIYHPFTTDNQDYLAYTCLILGSKLISLDGLREMLTGGEIKRFDQFLNRVHHQVDQLPQPLRDVHDDFYQFFQAGDPTPFKTFRAQEYITTTARMGSIPDEENISEILRKKLVITQEVREAALRWKRDGALLMGLSDKPDEACFPGKELADLGHLPLHKTETLIVGE